MDSAPVLKSIQISFSCRGAKVSQWAQRRFERASFCAFKISEEFPPCQTFSLPSLQKEGLLKSASTFSASPFGKGGPPKAVEKIRGVFYGFGVPEWSAQPPRLAMRANLPGRGIGRSEKTALPPLFFFYGVFFGSSETLSA